MGKKSYYGLNEYKVADGTVAVCDNAFPIYPKV